MACYVVRVAAAALLLTLAACVTGYNARGLTGGWEERQTKPDTWWVSYRGNGYTSRETVQTYFLFRAAELTLAQGYDGFELSRGTYLVESEQDFPPYRIAATTYVPIIIPSTGRAVEFPTTDGTITMLRGPVVFEKERVFDARKLKAALEPLVHGPKCDMGNICPHEHRYLYEP